MQIELLKERQDRYFQKANIHIGLINEAKEAISSRLPISDYKSLNSFIISNNKNLLYKKIKTISKLEKILYKAVDIVVHKNLGSFTHRFLERAVF